MGRRDNAIGRLCLIVALPLAGCQGEGATTSDAATSTGETGSSGETTSGLTGDAATAQATTEGDAGTSSGEPDPALVPDFSLEDVSPSSSRFGEQVSPRDYEGRVSAWYFIHAT